MTINFQKTFFEEHTLHELRTGNQSNQFRDEKRDVGKENLVRLRIFDMGIKMSNEVKFNEI